MEHSGVFPTRYKAESHKKVKDKVEAPALHKRVAKTLDGSDARWVSPRQLARVQLRGMPCVPCASQCAGAV